VNSPSPSQQAVQKVMDHELALAQARGAEEVRAHVRHLVDEHRRVVRLGEQQIEVVEVAALLDLLREPEPE
jgi:hypothetical protein